MLRRRGWSTLSKAFDRSTAAATVRARRRRELKPVAIRCAIGSSEVTVECHGLKPCCEETVTRESEMYGSNRRSRILTAGQRREMGRYEEPWF
jgi:hypothetical protein